LDFSNPLIACGAAFLAGLVASASPCTLVLFPLIIGYVGGYAGGDVKRSALYALLFSLGLAVTFTLLGAIAALTGSLLGDIGGYWKYALALASAAVGLQLLGAVNLNIPTTDLNRIRQRGLLGAIFLGLLFGVATSPCSTPILAVILAYVASARNLFYGISLLFAYSLGYMVMIFAAGLSAGAATALLNSPRFQLGADIARKFSGLVFLLAGIYFLFML
jgi:cytochrome c biogenesis protein CcdA